MRPRVRVASTVAVSLVSIFAATGCGGGDGEASSDGGGDGRQIAIDEGCAGCHGADGQGGVGPAWTGLYNSTVELDGGGSVVADDAYLRRAIIEPDAEKVAGAVVAMPKKELSPADVDAIVAYIRELAETEPG